MAHDLGLPEDCFTNPAKRAKLIRIIKYWCTETRSDYKKTVSFFLCPLLYYTDA